MDRGLAYLQRCEKLNFVFYICAWGLHHALSQSDVIIASMSAVTFLIRNDG